MPAKQRPATFQTYGVALLTALVALAFGYLAVRQSFEIVALSRQEMRLKDDVSRLRNDVAKLQPPATDAAAVNASTDAAGQTSTK